jgi:hypothetical protein
MRHYIVYTDPGHQREPGICKLPNSLLNEQKTLKKTLLLCICGQKWQIVLCVAGRSTDAGWPIVLGYARPEFPYRDDGEEGEESFEETAVYLAICRVADVHADYVLEYLADCETENC